MAHLSLSFLGPFQVTLDGQALTAFESAKVRTLLAYLVMEADRPHPREVLVGLLWPDFQHASALTNLRRALANLRACIGDREADPPFLLITREAIRWNPAGDYALDVTAFQSAVQRVRGGEQEGDPILCARARCDLASAVQLYRGAFLDGLSVDSPPCEEWITMQRERLRWQVLDALERLAAEEEREGHYERAHAYAQRQVDLDPLREEGQRQLMRALALRGERNAALAQYQACQRVLAQELGVEPTGETTALYEAIRQGTLGSPSYGRPIHELALHEAPAETPIAEERVPEPPRPLFVAREQELARLGVWLHQVLAGQGRVGFVVGDPGSGKTVLLREFARRAMERYPQLVVAWGNCNAYAGMGDPYLPFVEILHLLMGDVEARHAVGALRGEHARRLQAIGPLTLQALLEVGPALIDALLPGVVLLDRARALPDGAAWVARVQEALSRRVTAPFQAFLYDQATRVLGALARDHPLVLILDDLQWSDVASISLLFHLGRRLTSPGEPGPCILVLGAYRPDEVAAGREGKAHPLEPVVLEFQRIWGPVQVDLDLAEGQAFVDALLDSEPHRLSPATRRALYRHTGGHALFTVELLRGLQERGDLVRDAEGCWIEGPALHWHALPERVEAVIAERIGRLPRQERELLSVASVEGQQFHAEVIARVLGMDARQLIGTLSGSLSDAYHLVRAHGLRRVDEPPSEAAQSTMGPSEGGAPPGFTQRLLRAALASGGPFSRYRFRHHLFHHYLYQHLDPVRRARLHAEVGSALEELAGIPSGPPQPPDTLASVADDYRDLYQTPERIVSEAQLAWHWEQAGMAEKAAFYHARAARRAAFLSSAYEEALSHYARELDLLNSLPEGPRRARYEWVCQVGRGVVLGCTESQILPEIGWAYGRALELAEQLDDELLLAASLSSLAGYRRVCGEPEVALQLSERALGMAQGGPPALLTRIQGEVALARLMCGEFAVCARLLAPHADALLKTGSVFPWWQVNQVEHMAWALWCLGYPDRAQRVSGALLNMVRRERDKLGIGVEAIALSGATCFIAQLCRDVAGVEEGVRLLLPLVEDDHCPAMRPMGTVYRGWMRAQQGDRQGGIALLRQGLAGCAQNATMQLPHWKGYVAEALGRVGQAEEGLALLSEAMAQVERLGERFNEAELHRLKGELLLLRGEPSSQRSYSNATLLPQTAWEKGEEAGIAGGPHPERSGPNATLLPSRVWGKGDAETVAAASCRAPLAEAEACFRRAIAVAQKQEARSWELRATTSLARLLQKQGRAVEAREMLSAIYGWFTEGFDTQDLVEAKALLAELGR